MTSTPGFKVWAYSASGRMLSLAASDYANSAEHVELATAKQVMLYIKATRHAMLLDYDTEEYALVGIDYFAVRHPHGGLERIDAREGL